MTEAIAFDTHRFVKRLMESGFTEKHAETLAEEHVGLSGGRTRLWLPEGFNPFYGKYTPNNVLDGRTKSRLEVLGKPVEIEGELKADFGLQLAQLAQALRAHGLDVTVRVVEAEADAETVRRKTAANLATEPAPRVWVGSDDLIAAMCTFHTVENRGYLPVSETR